jgi:hypothetical protein
VTAKWEAARFFRKLLTSALVEPGYVCPRRVDRASGGAMKKAEPPPTSRADGTSLTASYT